ncbi:MAG: glycosyltransferase family A protein [Opitutus sp.]
MKYIVITPVRNEAKHLSRTIASMLQQSAPPEEWIVVDDGSTDGTNELIQAATTKAPWIRLVNRPNRGFRKAGAGVVEAFYDGFDQHQSKDWDFVVKMDGDLEFDGHYFERLISAFEADPKLGIAGGDIYHHDGPDIVIESRVDPEFHVRGANKAYRRECWEQMSGLFRVTGWDTLDEVKANMLGWTTRRISALRMLHLKPTGSADGKWKDAFKNGRGSYICGYHPLFLCARSSRRLLGWPPLVESAGLLAGYVSGAIMRKARVPDTQLIRYVRTQQLNKLLFKQSLWSRR